MYKYKMSYKMFYQEHSNEKYNIFFIQRNKTHQPNIEFTNCTFRYTNCLLTNFHLQIQMEEIKSKFHLSLGRERAANSPLSR
ncbi:hypothetical protein LguiA_014819 [Lonicera macranthoides]